MSLELKPISVEYVEVIHSSIFGNVAEYFYDFKTIEETKKWVEEAASQHQAEIKEEFIILDNGEFIGMVSPNFITPRKVGIGIWISENKQGKGYAKKSLQKLFEQLAKRGVEEVYYETEISNEASVRLAESLEFECISKENDILHYKKLLS